MGYLLYKSPWTPCITEELYGVMESANLMDKYDAANQINNDKVVGHLPLGKSGKIAKTKFYL